MKLIGSSIFGAFTGFCSIMLHNLYPPYGFISSILITYLGMRIINRIYFLLRYQLFTAAAWLAVIISASNSGSGNEVLIYGNTYGNLYLLVGFLTLIISLFIPRRLQN